MYWVLGRIFCELILDDFAGILKVCENPYILLSVKINPSENFPKQCIAVV